MKWFRFYHEAYRNPKVQDMRPELFRFWINFLCVASESETRGMVPSEAHLARALGLSKAVVKRYCAELEGLVLLHRSDTEGAPKEHQRSTKGAVEEHQRNTEGLTPHDWHALQPDSDDSAKRQRDKRARDCVEQQPEMSRDMSRDVSRDGSVTRVRASFRREGDIEEEEKTPPSSPRKRGEARAAFVLPEWVPRKEWDAFMESRRKLRKIPTDHAKDLLVRQLEDFRALGHDPAAILNKSTERGWTGLFAPDGNSRGPVPVIHKPVDEEKLRPQPIRINDRMSPKTRRISIEQNRANGFPDDGVIAS